MIKQHSRSHRRRSAGFFLGGKALPSACSSSMRCRAVPLLYHRFLYTCWGSRGVKGSNSASSLGVSGADLGAGEGGERREKFSISDINSVPTGVTDFAATNEGRLSGSSFISIPPESTVATNAHDFSLASTDLHRFTPASEGRISPPSIYVPSHTHKPKPLLSWIHRLFTKLTPDSREFIPRCLLDDDDEAVPREFTSRFDGKTL